MPATGKAAAICQEKTRREICVRSITKARINQAEITPKFDFVDIHCHSRAAVKQVLRMPGTVTVQTVTVPNAAIGAEIQSLSARFLIAFKVKCSG
jgi:hypothetical protein